MPDDLSLVKLKVATPATLPVPPYANSTFSYANNPQDVSIIFMRIPLLTDDQVKALKESGATAVTGELVATITLPKAVAADLGEVLRKVTK